MTPRKKRPALVIGWRERIALPEFGIGSMRAKIDTGARTSALHALDQERFDNEGVPWVRFRVPLPGTPRTARVAARILDERDVKNTSGTPERRIVIPVLMILGWHHWHIEVTLANREKMEFDMILGRTAIRRRGIMVDPGRSWLAGSPRADRSDPAREADPAVPEHRKETTP
jgi:hypothetical protein